MASGDCHVASREPPSSAPSRLAVTDFGDVDLNFFLATRREKGLV